MVHRGMPRPEAQTLTKADLLAALVRVDSDVESSERALAMETEFRTRIESHVRNLPTSDAALAKFNTNPFVLMFYALQHGLTDIDQIAQAILPAKVFSSMETSAGRMVEAVVLPQYGWEFAPSEMHTSNSALDGKKMSEETLFLATLKSGPRCLNDEMSENFADTIVTHSEAWANESGAKKIDFTYGVLYGTKKQSNKKDWHILRNIARKMTSGVRETPENKWRCRFEKNGIDVTVTVRIGIELWDHIAGHDLAFVEICTALVRACVKPSEVRKGTREFAISDLHEIVSLEGIPRGFNTKIIQRSQIEWLFFFARHFCDVLDSGDLDSLSRSE